MLGLGVKLTLAALVVLPRLHGLEASGTANQLVAELGLVVVAVVVVDLVTGLLGFAYNIVQLVIVFLERFWHQ